MEIILSVCMSTCLSGFVLIPNFGFLIFKNGTILCVCVYVSVLVCFLLLVFQLSKEWECFLCLSMCLSIYVFILCNLLIV